MLASYTTFECTNADNEGSYHHNDDNAPTSDGKSHNNIINKNKIVNNNESRINDLLSTMASAHYE